MPETNIPSGDREILESIVNELNSVPGEESLITLSNSLV